MDAIARPPAGNRALAYDGRIGEIYAIFLLNLLFTILTLGIFRFWAITRYRRYFWSRFRFQGERFEYTGTGGELFVGFLLAGLLLLGLAGAAGAVAFGLSLISESLTPLPLLLFELAVIVLAAGAVFSAQRYRLSRTLWCGIRGGMTGSMMAYGVRVVGTAILAALTLGQLVPWMQIRLAERRINASSLGSARFTFRGSAKRVYLAYLATLVATIVVFVVIAGGAFLAARAIAPDLFDGSVTPNSPLQQRLIQSVIAIPIVAAFLLSFVAALIACWYSAAFERHVVGNSTLGPVRFASSMTGPGLLRLVAGNLLITLFTLGLGYPVVLHRNARFLADTMWAVGTLESQSLMQSNLGSPSFGEGMFQQLDATGWM